MARFLPLWLALCAAVLAAPGDASARRLTGVRYLSSANYTRVILDLAAPVKYAVHRLDAAPGKGLPPRIYLDLSGTRLAVPQRRVEVNDRLVQRVRMNQYRKDVARVVLDLKHPGVHDAALLAGPHRILVDVERKGRVPAGRKPEEEAVRRSLRKVVLDPGHGGKDPGAVGLKGLREKDVTLAVAKGLAGRLRREMGVDVVLTRDRDVSVSLKKRTNIATRAAADLFVSIHSNASANRKAAGLETYYLDHRIKDRAILKLAARENGTSLRKVEDLQYILSDLKLSSFACYTPVLADKLQSSLVRKVRPHYGKARNLGVKKGPFYVLTVGEMPAALVELLFVSNPRDAGALRKKAVKSAIVEGLSHGVRQYADKLRNIRCPGEE